jgi:hypothetical protein
LGENYRRIEESQANLVGHHERSEDLAIGSATSESLAALVMTVG